MAETFGILLGRAIREARESKGWTQLALAERAFADPAKERRIRDYESGKVANPQPKVYAALCDALGLSRAQISALKSQASNARQQDNSEIAELIAQLGSLETAFSDLRRLSRDQLELLASRFGILAPHDRSDGDLRGLLTDKATEYRALKAQIDALLAKFPQLGNVVAEARARLDDGDTEGVHQMVRDARRVLHDAHLREGLEQDAELVELDAAALLLDNRVDEAFAQLTAAADSFAGIDPLEPAQRRVTYAEPLYQHGLRYGGPGLAPAARMLREALARTDRTAQPQLWAYAQNNLANALQKQGSRTAGSEGAALLEQAVGAYRAALEVYTRQAQPLHWAMAQNNLANALAIQGIRTAGPEGTALLDGAVKAYRSALEVRTRQAHPLDWAMTQNNLANALRNQGIRTAGPKGAALLDQAVKAYRLALEVHTRQAHLLDWAMTQENLALAHQVFARHDTCTDAIPPLRAALEHVNAALEVFDPVHLPYDHGTATALRERILAALNA